MAEALPDVTGAIPESDDKHSLKSSSEISVDIKPSSSEIQWEIEGTTLDYVSQEERLPSICQFEEIPPPQGQGHDIKQGQGQRNLADLIAADSVDKKVIQLSPGLKVFSRQPVVLHSRISKRQARSRTIYKDTGGAYYEIGQTLIIPEEYSGWFELVPSDFSRASCYLSIAAVAQVMPAKFFTRSNLRGIRIQGEGDQQKYLERKIPSGSVLQTNGTFKAKWKTRAETGWLSKKTTEWEMEEVEYLRCVDSDQAEVLVPLSHKGKFNAIYSRGQLAPNAVYSMKDILSDLALPVKVRLLYGKAPVVPCIFTGMLIVREFTEDNVVVGSTVLNRRNVLFELPLHSPVTVKYTSSDEQLANKDTYKDAQKLCRKYAHLYNTMIKLSPDLDTGQKVIQHVPSDPEVTRATDEALRALDLITDISLTSEPQDHLLDGSDTSSIDSGGNVKVMPSGARLENQSEIEYKTRESHSHV